MFYQALILLLKQNPCCHSRVTLSHHFFGPAFFLFIIDHGTLFLEWDVIYLLPSLPVECDLC